MQKCMTHGLTYTLREKRRSAEADWCGDWYECPACGVTGGSVLVPSADLRAFLEAAR